MATIPENETQYNWTAANAQHFGDADAAASPELRELDLHLHGPGLARAFKRP